MCEHIRWRRPWRSWLEPGLVSRPLAGGTDVVVFVRHEKPPFDRVVDITRVPELKLIERRGD